MLIRNRLFLRGTALLLAFQTLISAVLPVRSYALTAGPSAPEYTSFEPIDTTDMVNLATGGMVYNVSLLEVPGPGGGFPLSASYHAGIMQDQEASWIGLGWNVNVGAINRSVAGFADDFENARREVRDYWDGGETTTKTYSLSITAFKGIGINYTLARSRDTYRGFSVNHYASLRAGGMSIDTKGNVSVSFDPGQLLLNTVPSSNVSASLGTVYKTLGGSSVGFTIGSKGIKTFASVLGSNLTPTKGDGSSVSSFTSTNNIGSIPLLTWGYLSLNEYHTRYWTDQADALFAYGSLYAAKSNSKSNHFASQSGESLEYNEYRSYANDVYDLYDTPGQDVANWDLFDDADASRQSGGSLMSLDRYDVLGQGIGGIIEPAIFENGDIRGQNIYVRNPSIGTPITDHPTLEYKSMRPFTEGKKVNFRFKNDFSNGASINPEQISSSYTVNEQTVVSDNMGFISDETNQYLEGSRHIEWFTNGQIASGEAFSKKFIDAYEVRSDRQLSMDVYDNYLQPEAFMPSDKRNQRGKGSGLIKTDNYAENPQYTFIGGARYQSLKPRSASLAEKIGGFMITNESGVTYHYALPVYARNEYTRIKMKKPVKDAATITEVKTDEPYAYTWLLTAITGPDYVDRGGANNTANGVLDDSDYGYWVKFDYGKWADNYQWRTPHSGYTTDMESEYASFSYGIKELYYLDAIETRTHKAVFIKSKRKDGKGVTSRLEGGSNPRRYRMQFKWYEENVVEPSEGNLEYSVSPVSTLKLDAIYLFDKAELQTVPITKDRGDKYIDAPPTQPHTYYYQGDSYSYTPPGATVAINIQPGIDHVKVSYHNGDEVFDDGDIVNLSDFKDKASKIVRFDSDYSLGEGSTQNSGVPNSFDYFSSLGRSCVSGCGTGTEWSYEFEWPLGVGCGRPSPICCNDSDANAFYSAHPLEYFAQQACNQGSYLGGDIEYIRTGKLTLKAIKTLGRGGADIMPPIKLNYNRNVAYNSDQFDEWGYFKSDYRSLVDEKFKPIVSSRRVTASSSASVDAWSLSGIKTPTGATININYEANQYSRSVYNNFDVMGIETAEPVSSSQVKLTFKEQGFNLNSIFSASESVDLRALIVSTYMDGVSVFKPTPDYYIQPATISSVGEDNIIINAPELSAILSPGRTMVIDELTRTLTPYFIGGALKKDSGDETRYAGGVRVKSIQVKDFGGHEVVTEYGYQFADGRSTGRTSYKPYSSVGFHYPSEVQAFSDMLNESSDHQQKTELSRISTRFIKHLNDWYEDLLVFGREAPAPGVVYEQVEVRSKYDGQEVDNFKRYQFEVFDRNMITRAKTEYGTSANQRSTVEIANKAVSVGNLKKVFNVSRTGHVLSEIKYGYLQDEETSAHEQAIKDSGQGVFDQSFHKYVTVKNYINHGNGTGGYNIETINSVNRAVVTKSRDYADVMTSVEEVNYKTGIRTTQEYRGFDYYSGQPTMTVTTDEHGNTTLTEIVPAYRLTNSGDVAYPALGLKMSDVQRKHMLIQDGATYGYRLNSDGDKTHLLSASIQTWSNLVRSLEPGEPYSLSEAQSDVWRKHASFLYVGGNEIASGSGLIALASGEPPLFTAWNWHEDDNVPQGWYKTMETTLFDVHSNEVEAKDMNGHFAATLMSLDQSRVIAAVSNSRFTESAYTGAEEVMDVDKLSPSIAKGSGSVVPEKPHSGSHSLLMGAGETGFETSLTTTSKRKAMQISVWIHQDNTNGFTLEYTVTKEGQSTPVLTGAPALVANPQRTAGVWVLVEATIPIPESPSEERFIVHTNFKNTGSSPLWIDDFRIHPFESAMTGYVYNGWGDVWYVLDRNNLFTRYEYDNLGRLQHTYRESFTNGEVHVSDYIYQFGSPLN